MSTAGEGLERCERIRRFLREEAWPVIAIESPPSATGKAEREEILGYGPDGV